MTDPKTHNTHTIGYWQQELPKLGKFSAVFLDDFPLPLDRDGSSAGEDKDKDGEAKARRQAQRDERRIMAAVGSRWHAFLDLVLRWVMVYYMSWIWRWLYIALAAGAKSALR